MAAAGQQKSTFLPLSPIHSTPSASSTTSTPQISVAVSDTVSVDDIVVPFGRARTESNASSASSNSYLWLSTAKQD
jgi:hypothetical protein